jgi:putative membrane protein
MNLLLRWVASAAAVGAAAYFVPGITVTGGIKTYFVVALLLGLVNAVVRPIVKALACGLIMLTLGLFLLVINAAMLWVTSLLAQHFGYGFYVSGIEPALVGSLVISLVSWVLSLLLTDDDRRKRD